MFFHKFKLFIPLVIFSLVPIIQSCEEIPNEILEQETVEFTISAITAPDVVILSESNSATTTITIDNAETVNTVWFNISTINGTDQISSNNEMVTTSTSSRKVYIGEYEFDQELLPGNYEFSYYVEDAVNVEGENIRKVGTKQFLFILEEENAPPILSSPNVPESTPQGSRVVISVRVIDSNGPDDINQVYFKLTDPDNNPVFYDETNTISDFPLLDDGENGDIRRNDGIYSSFYSFSDSAKLGEWKFEIEAKDNDGALSNLIERNTLITVNFPPEIGDLVIPSEIDRGVEFVFSLTASDPNGLSDINFVYFELLRPDGTIVYVDEDNTITTFPMFDNGDFDGAGDEIEGDGIYSLKNSFGPDAQTGDWTFTFNAIDNSGTVSNTITYSLKVN